MMSQISTKKHKLGLYSTAYKNATVSIDQTKSVRGNQYEIHRRQINLDQNTENRFVYMLHSISCEYWLCWKFKVYLFQMAYIPRVPVNAIITPLRRLNVAVDNKELKEGPFPLKLDGDFSVTFVTPQPAQSLNRDPLRLTQHRLIIRQSLVHLLCDCCVGIVTMENMLHLS